MARGAWAIVLATALLSLGGCLGGAGPEGEDAGSARGGDLPLSALPGWSERALPFGEGHDHNDAAQHAGLSTPNFEVVGYSPLISDYYGTSAGGYLCGDVGQAPDGRRIAAVESRSDVGFAVADVTDAANPEWLGELVMRATYVYDLAVVPDGEHVVLVTQNVLQDQLIPSPIGDGTRIFTGIEWRSPCTPEGAPLNWAADDSEDLAPRPMSLLLVSIADPSNPTIIDHHPLLGYGHSAYSAIIDGRTWLMLTTRGGNPALTSFYEFYQIVDTPAGGRLNPLSVYNPTGPLEHAGHDGWIAKHPGTDQLLGYFIGSSLMGILDLADPRQPELLDTWTDVVPGREGFSAALHSVYPLPELWGGRHYTIIGPEFGGHPAGIPSGIIWVLDTTDPTDIFEVAAWTLPHEVEWNGTYMFSNHYFSVVGKTLFVSMYHGGAWAVDLTPVGTVEFALLDSIGVFMPDLAPPSPPAITFRWTPTLEEMLAFPDGVLVTFDSNSGLYVLRFDETNPMPRPDPWPIEPVG